MSPHGGVQTKFTRIVTMEEVVKNDYNLSPSRYVETGTAEVYRPIPELLKEIAVLESEEQKNRAELSSIFTKMGYLPEAKR